MSVSFAVMRRLFVASFATVFILASTVAVQASWLIEEKKFHASAHGQVGCLECHEDIQEKELHPDPEEVGMVRTDFFNADQCFMCHDDIEDGLAEGIHGSKDVEEPEKYALCIRCHKPHHQMRRSENSIGTFEPGTPRYEQCGACHNEASELPDMSDEDESCMTCHRRVDETDPEGKAQVLSMCLHCHGMGDTEAQKKTSELVPLIDHADYMKTAHASLACTTCHVEAAGFDHHMQTPGDCSRCHNPHHEKMAHDAHFGVACQSCHMNGVKALKGEDGTIAWEREKEDEDSLTVHDMVLFEDNESCSRCHYSGNSLGASSMVLPAKGLLCMPCHTSTFSIGDTVTILSLLIFISGIVLFFSVLLSGSLKGHEGAKPLAKLAVILQNTLRAVFSARIGKILNTLFFDVLLQRRLFMQSPTRWLIHSLIFLPFLFRFLWGLVALVGSLWEPEGTSFVWDMIHKNHPLTAFVFDLSGILILAGIVLAFVRGLFRLGSQKEGLPNQDRLALGLIGGIVVVGFILEAIRIAMTGWPDNSGYAFIGYTLSMIFSGTWLTGIYGFVWYLHAILTGIFIAYLPFSRLFHIILGPIMLAVRAAEEEHH